MLTYDSITTPGICANADELTQARKVIVRSIEQEAFKGESKNLAERAICFHLQDVHWQGLELRGRSQET